MMNKPELINKVALEAGVTKKDAEAVVEAVFKIIRNNLIEKNEKVVITGFGTFEVHERSAKQGRNIQTGATILIEGSKAPVFKAAKTFKEEMNA